MISNFLTLHSHRGWFTIFRDVIRVGVAAASCGVRLEWNSCALTFPAFQAIVDRTWCGKAKWRWKVRKQFPKRSKNGFSQTQIIHADVDLCSFGSCDTARRGSFPFKTLQLKKIEISSEKLMSINFRWKNRKKHRQRFVKIYFGVLWTLVELPKSDDDKWSECLPSARLTRRNKRVSAKNCESLTAELF